MTIPAPDPRPNPEPIPKPPKPSPEPTRGPNEIPIRIIDLPPNEPKPSGPYENEGG